MKIYNWYRANKKLITSPPVSLNYFNDLHIVQIKHPRGNLFLLPGGNTVKPPLMATSLQWP